MKITLPKTGREFVLLIVGIPLLPLIAAMVLMLVLAGICMHAIEMIGIFFGQQDELTCTTKHTKCLICGKGGDT